MKKLLLVLCMTLQTLFVVAQAAKKITDNQFVGSWKLVSIDNISADGTRVRPYGENPKGLLMFDASGNYAIQILKAVRAKIVSGDKNKCTPEENAAIVQGTNSHFGTYSVDETNKSITFSIINASFPNWEGTQQVRSYTYNGSALKYVVTHTTQGGEAVTAEVVWKRF